MLKKLIHSIILLCPKPSSEFQNAKKIYPHDRLLAVTVLKLISYRFKPNHITIFRFLATPVVVLLIFYEQYLIGLFAFLITAFSDMVDGSMARTRNQITDWGKIYDPVADKVLIGAMVFIIVFQYINFWTAFIIMLLEILAITFGWIKTIRKERVQANVWGKVKMVLQVTGISFLLLIIIFNWAIFIPLVSGVFYLAIVFAIVSLLMGSA